MPTNPRIVHELIMPCSLNTVKHLTTLSRVGTVLEVLACCVPSLPGKEIKLLLLFPPNSISIFLFDIGAQRAKILAAIRT